VTVVTGSSVKGSRVDFACLANADVTLVVLMGVERRAEIAAELIEGGLAPSTPVGVVEWPRPTNNVACAVVWMSWEPVTCVHPRSW